MLVLNESQMWQAVTLDEVLEAVEDAFAIHRSGRYLMPDRSVAEQDGDKLMFIGKLIQLLQHQHGNPGIIPRQNPLNLRVIPVIILNHRPEIRSPVIPVHQLQLINSRARIPKGPVNHLHCLILCHSVQVNLHKRFIHIQSISVFCHPFRLLNSGL